MSFSGDLTPVMLASGTEITSGTEVTVGLFTNANSALTAMLKKPMLYVKVTTATAVTGSIVITYQEKINDFHIGVDKNVTVPMTLQSAGSYAGIAEITNDFSAITIKGITNGLDDDTVTYQVFLIGMVWD
jgi:hypothetical protein